MEILKELPGSFHDRTILNEKLKKRQRSSPSAFSGGGDCGGCSSYNNSSLMTWSSQEEAEDMDVANCLILLARGGGGITSNNDAAAKYNNHQHETSRKFTEIPSTSNAKVGIYVYECKTCSRVFPSFQALGGHRASHKKPKLVPENNDHIEEQVIISKVDAVVIASSPTKQQLVNNDIISNNNKVHECSICGAEFASGQALGGHMRRHRPSSSLTGNKECDDAKNFSITRNVFVLDLNMPAPLEADDHKPHATLLTPPLVMVSGAKLVDCHY